MIIYRATGYTASASTVPGFTGSGWTSLSVWYSTAGTPDGSAIGYAPTLASTSAQLMIAATITVTGAAPVINMSGQIWTGNGYVDVFVLPIDVDLVSLNARRQMCLQRGKARDQRRIEFLQMEHKQVSDLRAELDELKRIVSNGAERHNEKEDDGGLLPPPRSRKRVIEQESDDDGVSVVSVTQGRSKSQPARAG